MKKNVTDKPLLQIDHDLRRSSADGIAVLLGAIQPNIRAFCNDEVCARLIGECLAHLRSRYRVPVPTTHKEAEVETASFAALVRLLLYVRAELVDELGEVRCANLLHGCIDHLLKSHLHYPTRSNGPPTHPVL